MNIRTTCLPTLEKGLRKHQCHLRSNPSSSYLKLEIVYYAPRILALETYREMINCPDLRDKLEFQPGNLKFE